MITTVPFGIMRPFLAQDFKLQPLLLGRGQLALGFAEVGGDFFETGAVAHIKLRIGELGLQLVGFGLQRGHGLGQRFERVLFLEFHLALGGPRLGGRRGALGRLLFLGLDLLARQIGAALRQHVAIAAGIFGPAAVALRRDHAAHQPIEEIAVMADQQHGAGIVADHLLEHVERFQVEIVGRLVEHQQVRRLRQRPRQHQAAALAARQFAERRARLLARKQKVLHVADDVLRLAADHDAVAAAAGQRVGDGDVGIEAVAMLVERRDRQRRAEPDRAGVRRQHAGQQIDQRGLAAAVRPDDADAVAALDADRKVADDRAPAIALADAFSPRSPARRTAPRNRR